jgi:hypothetical protein
MVVDWAELGGTHTGVWHYYVEGSRTAIAELVEDWGMRVAPACVNCLMHVLTSGVKLEQLWALAQRLPHFASFLTVFCRVSGLSGRVSACMGLLPGAR